MSRDALLLAGLLAGLLIIHAGFDRVMSAAPNPAVLAAKDGPVVAAADPEVTLQATPAANTTIPLLPSASPRVQPPAAPAATTVPPPVTVSPAIPAASPQAAQPAGANAGEISPTATSVPVVRAAQPPAATSTPAPTRKPAPSSTPTRDPLVVLFNESTGFIPSQLSVSVGQTVTWLNRGGGVHSIVSRYGHFTNNGCCAAMTFDSGGLKPGESFSYLMSEAGAFEYVDSTSALYDQYSHQLRAFTYNGTINVR